MFSFRGWEVFGHHSLKEQKRKNLNVCLKSHNLKGYRSGAEKLNGADYF